MRPEPMKVMIDTNVLISGALNPKGFVAKSLYKAMSAPFEPVVCDYIIDEVHRKFQQKFPDDIVHLETFLYNALQSIEVVSTPSDETEPEKDIRDIKDRPILRAAQAARVDYLLTGDKDFLESGITNPAIINSTDFMNL